MPLPFPKSLCISGIDPITGEYAAKDFICLLPQKANLLVYQKSASVRYQIEETFVSAPVGSLLLLSPGLAPQTELLKDGQILVIGFLTNEPITSRSPILLSRTLSKKLRDQILQVLYWSRSAEIASEFAMLAELYSLLYALQRYSSQGNRQALQNDLIRPSVAYLEKHYTNRKWSMAEVAALSGISEAHFRALFVRQYGCSPTAFLNRRKTEKAKQLLLCSPFSLKEIATACGFSDPAYFARFFQKQTGTTLEEYREQKKNGQKKSTC